MKYLNNIVKIRMLETHCQESKNFSFYVISGVKDENSGIEKKGEKEFTLYDQIIEKEMEKKEMEKKENESRRFHKIEGNYVPKNCIQYNQ